MPVCNIMLQASNSKKGPVKSGSSREFEPFAIPIPITIVSLARYRHTLSVGLRCTTILRLGPIAIRQIQFFTIFRAKNRIIGPFSFV
ncbi:uncharacterized protein Dvar_79490 [Desulfosarcina variabilis str. Montpellier]